MRTIYPNPMQGYSWNGPDNRKQATADNDRSSLREQLARLPELCRELTNRHDRKELPDLLDELDLGTRRWAGTACAPSRTASAPTPAALDSANDVSRVSQSLQTLIPMLSDRDFDSAARRVALISTLLLLTQPAADTPTSVALDAVRQSLVESNNARSSPPVERRHGTCLFHGFRKLLP